MESNIKKKLNGIVLYVNNICNASCKCCDIGQNKGRGIQKMVGSKKYLSEELLAKILCDQLVQGKELSFNLLMTEPLLSPNICKLIRLVKDEEHLVVLTTNGYLLPKKAKGLLDSGLDVIQVSIDGPPRINDWIRGQRNAFKNAIDGIKLLNELGSGKIFVRVNCTVSNMNCKHLEELADSINNETEIDRLKYQFLDFVTERMAEDQNTSYSIKTQASSVDDLCNPRLIDVVELFNQIEKLRTRTFTNIREIHWIPDISSEEDIDRYFNHPCMHLSGNDKCKIPFTQVAINTDGDVYFHMRCFDYKIGNLQSNRLSDIWKGKKAEYFRDKLVNANYCLPACTRCCGVMCERDITRAKYLKSKEIH